MGTDRPTFFSRDDVLGGLPARRASTLLFAVEKRTAQLAARSRTAMATWATERAEAEREQAFLEALAAGRGRSRPIRVQDLERYAPAWAALVPPDPALRASLAQLIGAKYRVPRAAAPRIRAALALDEPAVRTAFERLHGTAIESIFADRLTLGERIAWRRARLAERIETLPAFWTAFGLTFTEMVGAGLLALPIALAGVGALPAVTLLVAFGLLNMLTLAALVETITRDGSMRYGSAYFGRLIGNFLGRPGTALLGVTLLILNVLVIGVAAIGFGTTLQAATGIPAAAWIGLLLLVDLAFLRRESLDATIASALVIGGVNIGIVIAISVLALPHLATGNLAPPPAGAPMATSLVALAFGVVMSSYLGHTSAANLAKVVLARDPTGRELLRGSLLAVVAAIGVNTLFVLATLGAVGAARLSGEGGTPLAALAEVVGPGVTLLGTIYVLLALGIGSIHFTLGLANQVREYLPAAATPSRRLLLAAAPSVAVYGVILLAVLTGSASFSSLLGIIGTVVGPILAGIFPMLMLASARRRGEYVPASAPALLGHPVVVVAVSGFFLAAILAHGLFLWSGLPERLGAIGVAVLTSAVGIMALRRGFLTPRTVIELRRDQHGDDRARFGVTDAGRPLVSSVRATDGEGTREVRSAAGELGRFGTLRAAVFELPPRKSRDLKVWVHAVDADGRTTSVPAALRVERNGREPADYRMNGELLLQPAEPVSRVHVTLVPDAAARAAP